jgi:hypothetical protein
VSHFEEMFRAQCALWCCYSPAWVQDAWKELEYCVQTGNPAFRRTASGSDANAYALMAQNGEVTALFDEAMATFAPATAAAVAAAFDFSVFRKVADIGGGNGALLIGILKAYPALAGIVFDQPHAAERARERVAAAGLADRCEVLAGNFFDKVPGGADAYLLCNVLLDWDDDRASAILRSCWTAMPRHGQVLIVEGLYPARLNVSDQSRCVAGNDVLMLVCTGGRLRSEEEFRTLLASSGFRLSGVLRSYTGDTVLQAVRAD